MSIQNHGRRGIDNRPRHKPLHRGPVRDSQSQMAEVVLPNDANPLGNLLGGRLMHLIDIAGAIAAHRHSHSHVVTASMDHIDFRLPVKIGDLLILKSSVNRAFNTSMEVRREVLGGKLYFRDIRGTWRQPI